MIVDGDAERKVVACLVRGQERLGLLEERFRRLGDDDSH